MPDEPRFCAACGTAVPPPVLSCPACHALVHAGQLEELVKQARAAEASNKTAGIELWAKALELLPPESSQAAVIRDHISSLNVEAIVAPIEKPTPAWIKRLGPFGAIFALGWKFKALVLVFLTKAKFLLFGLAKLKTLLSMLATMGVYWSWYGWKFAVGFVLGIYVHEMGHVWALRQYGLRASAPMFIPGFGAFISLYDSPISESQDARIGLAGPLWGAGAAFVCLLPLLAGSGNIWFAIARATAFINLFNLVPIWQLDGGRGFRALDRRQRISLLVLMAILWFSTGQGLFFLLLLGGLYRVFWKKDNAPQGDQGAFLLFAALLVVFGVLLALIPVRQ